MTLINNIDQIKSLYKQAKKMDFSNLYSTAPNVQNWQSTEPKEVKDMVEETFSILNKGLKKPSLMRKLGFNNLTQIQNNLQNFINQYVGVENLTGQQLTSHHHNPLNQIQALNTLMRTIGLYTEIKLSPDIDKISEKIDAAESLADSIIDDKEKIEIVTRTFNNYLEGKTNVEKTILGESTDNFKSQALKYSQNNVWLYLSALAGAITLGTFYSVIMPLLESATDIGLGEAIMRITIILIPTYFIYFFTDRYIQKERLHDIYSFKESSLGTMQGLYDQYDESFKIKIVDKTLDVLFSDPVAKKKGSEKLNKDVVSKAFDLVEKAIPRQE